MVEPISRPMVISRSEPKLRPMGAPLTAAMRLIFMLSLVSVVFQLP